MKKLIEKAQRKLSDLELAGVVVEPAPDLTDLDAQRVRSYPVSAPRTTETERREFGDGLLERVHGVNIAAAERRANAKRLAS